MSFLIMGFIIIYPLIFFIALWLVPKVVHHKHIKRIIFIVWFLIPTWDVIIGYPIYKFLCWTSAGTHIYKTVDNVEGFYVGEQSKKFEPREPYEGYRYVDYKEEKSRKYYRSYWLDNNTSELCVSIGDDKWTHNGELYSKHFESGKCIVKEEISKSEVSRWEIKKILKKEIDIPLLGIRKIQSIYIFDRLTKKRLSERKYVYWRAGYVLGYFFTGWGSDLTSRGFTCDSSRGSLIDKTLKPKGEN